MSTRVHIEYYAAARELAGCSEETVLIEHDVVTGRQVLAWIGEQHPALGRVCDRMRLAINDDLTSFDTPVRDGDRVAVLPPVAGGCPNVHAEEIGGRVVCDVRPTPLSLDEAMQHVRHDSAGGVCMFIGVVRDHADGKAVARLDYEAHGVLALKEMQRILTELASGDPGLRLCALHRVGELRVGDLAVIVAASAPHRAEAFAVCRRAIDEIKDAVPIWKKEWEPDGTTTWVNL